MIIKLHKGLIRGSFILLIAFGLFSFFHFLFQVAMARMLTLSEYGTLAPLSAIIIIFLIFSESIQTIITKYSSEEKQKGRLKNLVKKSFKKASFISLTFFIFYLLLSIFLSYLLRINYLLLVLTGSIIFITFFAPITRGIMQGREKFIALGMNMILESSSKLIFGILFVFIGWKVFGAITGIITGGIISIIFSFIPLRDIIKSEEKEAKTIGIYNYAKPTLFITAVIVIFYSLDVIIAKIFFPLELMGSYAIASTLGKIIFWGTIPISKVMFPMSASENQNKKSKSVFVNALVILLTAISIILALFYFLPELIIRIFAGPDKVVPEAVSILFYLGIAFSFVSVTNLILLYKLSLKRVKGHIYLLLFIFIEVALLWFFKKNIFQFSIAFVTASATFLWGSIILMNK